MKEERIFFKNNKGQKLVGVLTFPIKKTKTAILNCHGFTSHKERHFIPSLSKQIAESEYVALRFDFTGNGESVGEFSEGTITQEINDIISAIDFLEIKGYNKFGIIGHSMGGGVVIGAGAIDNRIKAVCSLAPSTRYNRQRSIKRYGLKNLLKLQFNGHFIYKKKDGREFKITKEFVNDKKSNDFIKKIENFHKPLLIIHGTGDATVSFDEGRDLFHKAKNPKEFLAIGGADHSFSNNYHRQVMITAVVMFFKRHLL